MQPNYSMQLFCTQPLGNEVTPESPYTWPNYLAHTNTNLHVAKAAFILITRTKQSWNLEHLCGFHLWYWRISQRSCGIYYIYAYSTMVVISALHKEPFYPRERMLTWQLNFRTLRMWILAGFQDAKVCCAFALILQPLTLSTAKFVVNVHFKMKKKYLEWCTVLWNGEVCSVGKYAPHAHKLFSCIMMQEESMIKHCVSEMFEYTQVGWHLFHASCVQKLFFHVVK